MKFLRYLTVCVLSLSTFAHADDHGDKSKLDKPQICQGFGPQTPRDISNTEGTNTTKTTLAPAASDMNLCNIHFHKQAEHKGPEFSIKASAKDGGGYQCNATTELTKSELRTPTGNVCNGLKAGDTVEFHWVHSSCDTKPGPTLGACLTDACANPELRVETQVFLMVNDSDALQFDDFDYKGNIVNGKHQAKLPHDPAKAISFLGSTTGPSFTEEKCSPLQVTWNVSPSCAKMDINSLQDWCQDNAFDEDHGHGVRELVTSPELLSPIE